MVITVIICYRWFSWLSMVIGGFHGYQWLSQLSLVIGGFHGYQWLGLGLGLRPDRKEVERRVPAPVQL